MSATGTAAPPLLHIVRQHAEECASLRMSRRVLVRAHGIRLQDLERHDARIVAHLDGLNVAGADGIALAEEALDPPGTGSVFTAAALALRGRHDALLQRLIEHARDNSDAARGLVSALGWVDASSLRGVAAPLLQSGDAFRVRLGLAACALHGVQPGHPFRGDTPAVPELQTQWLTLLADQGAVTALGGVLTALHSDDPLLRFAAARAALLLGERTASLQALLDVVSSDDPWRLDALRLYLLAAPAQAAHGVLNALSKQAKDQRLLVAGIGWAGDPRYASWLIRHMDDPLLARLAGASFSLMTGVDLARAGLELPTPPSPRAEALDDPQDETVSLNEDEGLPWPDAAAISRWWQGSSHGLQPGNRFLGGLPPTLQHCHQLLGTAGQPVRRVAAINWCLLSPGTPLFNVAAPAWRQAQALRRTTA